MQREPLFVDASKTTAFRSKATLWVDAASDSALQ